MLSPPSHERLKLRGGGGDRSGGRHHDFGSGTKWSTAALSTAIHHSSNNNNNSSLGKSMQHRDLYLVDRHHQPQPRAQHAGLQQHPHHTNTSSRQTLGLGVDSSGRARRSPHTPGPLGGPGSGGLPRREVISEAERAIRERYLADNGSSSTTSHPASHLPLPPVPRPPAHYHHQLGHGGHGWHQPEPSSLMSPESPDDFRQPPTAAPLRHSSGSSSSSSRNEPPPNGHLARPSPPLTRSDYSGLPYPPPLFGHYRSSISSGNTTPRGSDLMYRNQFYGYAHQHHHHQPTTAAAAAAVAAAAAASSSHRYQSPPSSSTALPSSTRVSSTPPCTSSTRQSPFAAPPAPSTAPPLLSNRTPPPPTKTPPTAHSLKHRLLVRPPDLDLKNEPTWRSADRQSSSSDIPSNLSTKREPSDRGTPATPSTPASAGSSSAVVHNQKYPAHFGVGSLIQLSNGDLKNVEDLNTEDFVRSAEFSNEVRIDHSTVTHMETSTDAGTATISFSVGKQKIQVAVEATIEHPFFVFGQGWSSSNPVRTMSRYQLPCQQLKVGDVCISLTHREASRVSTTTVATPPSTSSSSLRSDEVMRPPPPPSEMQERRRSNSSSPSDKQLRRMSPLALSSSPLAACSTSSSPKSKTGLTSPSKQVVFSDRVVAHSPPVDTKSEDFSDRPRVAADSPVKYPAKKRLKSEDYTSSSSSSTSSTSHEERVKRRREDNDNANPGAATSSSSDSKK